MALGLEYYLEQRFSCAIERYDDQRITALMPTGWRDLPGIYLLQEWLKLVPFCITYVHIRNGMLEIEGRHTEGNSFVDQIFERFALSIKRESAKVCMVCGEKGMRRKLEEGKPCLCSKHYIQYVNEIS